MSGQTICSQCGAAYDASIFLPGQAFHCIECDARIEASGAQDAEAPRALGEDEPDTSVYQVSDALSREIDAAAARQSMEDEVTHATSRNPMSSERLDALDAAASELIDRGSMQDLEAASAPIAGPVPERDVIVRGKDTMTAALAVSDEQVTMRMPGLEGSLSSRRDEPTNITHLEPGMLDTLTPLRAQAHEPEATDVAVTPSIADFADVSTEESPLAALTDEDAARKEPVDWGATTESGVFQSAGHAVDAPRTVAPEAPEEADAALAETFEADKRKAPSASLHTLHSTVAVRESVLDSAQSVGHMEEMLLPLEEDSGTEALVPAASFEAMMAEEEETITSPSSQAEAPIPVAGLEQPGVALPVLEEAGPLEVVNEEEIDTADEPSPEDGPFYEDATPMPSHSELAQVLEEAGPLVVAAPQEGEKATQMDFPVPVPLSSDVAMDVAEEASASKPSMSNGAHLERKAYVPGISRSDEPIHWTPGGFWRRGLAWLIDVVLLYGVTGLGLYLWLRYWTPETWIRGHFVRLPPPLLQFLTLLVIAFACVFVVLLANTLYYGIAYKYKGASVGKGLLGLQVRHAHTDGFIGFKQAFLREVIGKFLSVFLLLGGLLMAGVRKDKQSLHDLVFTTQVVRRPEE